MNRQKWLKKAVGQTVIHIGITIALSGSVFATEQESVAELPDITVQASKKGTSTFDTPTSVSVIEGDEIEKRNYTVLNDIAAREPNVYLTDVTNSTPTLTIRGMGFSDDESDSSSNSIYIDGIPIISQALGQLFDLQQIEILRGPQSTLYGQSSIGGVMALQTRDPGDVTGGSARIDVGTDNRVRVNLSGDVALQENTAVRLVLGGEDADGYITNTNLDRDDTGGWESLYGRIKLLHEDESGGVWRVGLHHMELDSGNDFFTSPTLAKEHKSIANEAGKTNTEYQLISLDYQRTLESGIELTTVLGANTTRWEYVIPTSVYGAGVGTSNDDGNIDAQETQQLSAEIRFAHSNEQSDWLTGVYVALFERESPFQFDLLPFFLSETRANIESRTFALFGEYGHRFEKHWRLAGALRLEDNRRRMDWRGRSAGLFDSDGDLIPDTPFDTTEELKDVKADDTEILPGLTLQYAPDEQNFGWIKVERGYKASGFNLYSTDPDLARLAYEPEFGNYIELGYRLRAADRRWEVGVTLFNMELKDQQVFTIDDQGRNLIDNAAESHSRGLELSGYIKPTDDLTISGYIGLLDAEYDEYLNGSEDLSGEQFANAPDSSYGVTVEWTPTPKWETSLSATYRSGSALFPDISTDTDAYTLVDAHVAYQDGSWSYGLYGKNLLDEHYLTRAVSPSLVVAGNPRTLGAFAQLAF